MADPLELLRRTDKHYLGSGAGIIFAPCFPRWLDVPGFWDEAHVYHYPLAPLFTVTFVAGDPESPGPAIPLRQTSRRWSPAELVADYELGDELGAREHRSVLGGGWFLSEWALENRGDRPWTLLAVVWTVQDTRDIDLSSVRAKPGKIALNRSLRDRHDQPLGLELTLQAPEGVASCAYLSEGSGTEPRWELTPFPEKWRGGLVTGVHVGGISPTGVLFAAVATPVRLAAGGEATVSLWAGVRPVLDREVGPRRLPVGGSPGAESRSRWRAFFEGVPQLRCSDPFFQRYWYYRWYGLNLCSHEGGLGNLVHPGCCEGTGYFHVPISYSAQCHARELRWLADADRARGVILNFLAHPKENGQLHGRMYPNHLVNTDFYFADWGEAVLAVDQVHPDPGFLREVYQPLARYAEWLQRERDPDGTGLFDVIDHYETGQEYMSRYMAVSPDADGESWGNQIRLKGIDAAVYAYRLFQSLAIIAGRLHDFGEASKWIAAAERTGGSILENMWDGDVGIFSDVDPTSLSRTGAKAAVSFYPYFTDLVEPEHIDGLKRHLLDSEEFWTQYPVPSTSADDRYYSPDAEWKGKRHNCPWNGRVWPMANSHVAEAIARTAIEHDPSLREVAAEFILKFVRMLFLDGDPDLPNCYEHYNPETGLPSLYRGFDDYQHSWINDLIVKYVAGFRPSAGDHFVIDPFPFGLDSLQLSRLPFRGHTLDIGLDADRFWCRIDGRLAGQSHIGEPVEFRL